MKVPLEVKEYSVYVLFVDRWTVPVVETAMGVELNVGDNEEIAEGLGEGIVEGLNVGKTDGMALVVAVGYANGALEDSNEGS